MFSGSCQLTWLTTATKKASIRSTELRPFLDPSEGALQSSIDTEARSEEESSACHCSGLGEWLGIWDCIMSTTEGDFC